jgi:predicted TIM-barrel fold metal-dependent hydrolase
MAQLPRSLKPRTSGPWISRIRPEQKRRESIPARALPATDAAYKTLQDFIFRYIATECGRLGLAVHFHAAAGAGGYFHLAGANPLLLEPLFNDPKLRKTNFVMVHGGWPFTREVAALLSKPNAYADFSEQTFMNYPRAAAQVIREWLEYAPEKVLFATDAYPFSEDMSWEEAAWVANSTGREALGLALTEMMNDGEITRDRAVELARMVLRDNARKLYQLR